MENTEWHSGLEKLSNVEFIEGEIYLSENPLVMSTQNHPRKNQASITCICTKGEMKGQINQFSVHMKPSGILILLPEQIFQCDEFSEDFEGFFIIMTKRFIESINLPEGFSAFMSIRNTPHLPLTEKMQEAILNFYKMMERVIQNKEEGLNRKAIITHLVIAFFYGLGHYLHKLSDNSDAKRTRNEIIMEDFLQLVQKHYKQERMIRFYAEKLFVTPKYLSVVVKNASGKTAGQWIDDYVVLEAKALLKSTDMTVLQISDEMNFPSQSFFGKFFKREVGVSPKQYREMK